MTNPKPPRATIKRLMDIPRALAPFTYPVPVGATKSERDDIASIQREYDRGVRESQKTIAAMNMTTPSVEAAIRYLNEVFGPRTVNARTLVVRQPGMIEFRVPCSNNGRNPQPQYDALVRKITPHWQCPVRDKEKSLTARWETQHGQIELDGIPGTGLYLRLLDDRSAV